MNPRYEFTVSVDGQDDETGSSGDEPTETDIPTETATSTQTLETNTPPQTKATDTPSPTTTTAAPTPQQPIAATGETTTATDGPGFGLLAALFGLGTGG